MTSAAGLDPDRTWAVVPAYNVERTIESTVDAIVEDGRVGRVIVVDDGSTDRTADLVTRAGVDLVRHVVNGGKASAMVTGYERCDPADVDAVVFVDADLGDTAGAVVGLVDHYRPDAVVVGVPVAAAGRGGFGLVRDLATSGVEAAVGIRPRSALSGQRVVPRLLLDQITLADRFGVETAMTIDAIRLGYELVEVDIEADHHHRGKSVAGFTHRAGQGVDIVRALVPRLGAVSTLKVVVDVLRKRVVGR